MYGSHSTISFLCEDCNNFYQFELRRAITLKNRYGKYLCEKCRIPYAKEHRKKTNIEKYGASLAMNSKENIEKRNLNIDWKEVNKKTIKTKIEKYGSLENAEKLRMEKFKKTCLIKYGTENPQQVDFIKKKALQTRKENNVSTVSLKRRESYSNKKYEEFKKLGIEWIDKDKYTSSRDKSGNIFYHFKCLKCNNEYTASIHSNTPVCKKCNPNLFSGFSKIEKELCDYIKSIYNGTIIENDKKILDGKELDIYLPEKKIAIEMNGFYFHGQKSSLESKSYFSKKAEEKRLLCKEKDIQLINIDDVDYKDRPEVFQRFFKDLLLPRKRIYARQCEFKEIDLNTAKDFCKYYHVNGFRGGHYKCGLFYNNELIVVAIFAKHKKYENECVRLCYKTGYDVIGGWAKIQKHFGKPFLHYVNLKYFRGENKTGCGYRFVYNKKIVNRQQLQKKNLLKMFDDYDDSLSDFNNCLNHDFIAIYDCGNDIRFYN